MRALAILPVLLLTACGATEKEGAVGDKLVAREITVSLLKYQPENAGARVEVCTENGQAIAAFNFRLGDAIPLRPQRTYDDEFEVVREGCERGWIVFAVPPGTAPSQLTFRFDDTGSARPGDRENHIRFTWEL